ncbi:hypothetical protein [Nevskia soli]|jgi:hypothetical protein|uniref:hypothetical protein n=1 Tax=Nevskia soli TaxID=418856 RepID=UPI0015D749EF|nr:hypothetical protein [Nevskia soli]
MVTIKEATRNAIQFALDSLGEKRAQGIRLEEISSEVMDGAEYWMITLSMIDSEAMENPINALGASFGGRAKREYKIFAVAKSTGEVMTMRIREFATN